MAKRRRTVKTVEIHEVYVIRQTSGPLPALCAECQAGDAIMVKGSLGSRMGPIVKALKRRATQAEQALQG